MASPVSISAVLIVKNEEAVLIRCLKSLEGFDQVVVMDTGSTDNTIDIARSLKADVFKTKPIIPFHFAEARNRALEHAVNDWCFSIDADEVVNPGSLQSIRDAITSDDRADGINLTFVMRSELMLKPYPIMKLKAFRKSAYGWKYRVHEMLWPKIEKPIVIDVPEAIVEHVPVRDKAGRHSQNLELLKLCVQESPEYARAERQLALEYMLEREWERSIHHMMRWIERMPADDPLELSEANLYIGQCHVKMGQIDLALQWFRRAACAEPARREPFFLSANALIGATRLDEALFFLERLLEIPVSKKPNFYLNLDPVWDDSLPLEMVAFCKSEIGRAKDALRN